MAVAQAYGKTITSGSVFAYDVADTRNSYIGQPTTNIGNNFRDFTGTGYSPDGEWVSTEPTRFTKTYYPTLPTPIGPGGTLIEESGTGGYHHLSRYGGGNESGAHSLSCYIYPIVSGITDFCIGMLGDSSNNIRFNLDTREIIYGGGISNRNAFIKDIPGWPGWLRVGANIEGRGGGWVGCFGYSSYTPYTGTAGGKKAYITGIQYEYTTQPTPFVAGTRSATQALLPLVGNSTLNLSYVSFDTNAQMIFDGTNDYIDAPYYSEVDNNLSRTWEVVVKPTATMTYAGIFGQKIGYGCSYHCNGGIYLWDGNWVFDWFDNSSYQFLYSGVSPTPNQYFHIVATYDASDQKPRIYVNGVLKATYGSTTNMNYGGSTNIIDIGWNSKDGGQHYFGGELPVARHYSGKALTAAEVKQNFDFYDARFGIDVDTYYFVVSNRFSRSKWYTVPYTKIIADTTPAYIIYQKPDASFGNVHTYTEVASDPIGSPPKTTVLGNQYVYGSGRFLTSVTVRKSKVGGRLSFEFPDGGTTTYGEEFYKTIITPHVP